MHWLARIALVIAGNAFALWLANKYVPGFVLHATLFQLAIIGLVLSLLNFFLKPLLTLILGPVIVLTLGAGVLIANAIVIWLLSAIANRLDILHGSISIETTLALLLTTLLVSVANFVVHLL